MTAVDELIQKIAVKNGVMVGRDDPVMIVHTILEQSSKQTCATRKPHFSAHREELEAHAGRWGAEAKEKAERILTASLSASKALMSEALNEGASIAAKRLAEQVEASLEEANRSLRQCADDKQGKPRRGRNHRSGSDDHPDRRAPQIGR
jgi:regulator of protease activity HflC (stomatin/prohibitin superfamily)